MYVWPHEGLFEYAPGNFVTGRRGVIVLYGSEHEWSITHEFRHHIQATELRYNKRMVASAFNYDGSISDYWKQIRVYFRTQRHEMDALLYETRHAPCDSNLSWLECAMTANGAVA
jgi:hypothetical protein